jgi:hypothetical protein
MVFDLAHFFKFKEPLGLVQKSGSIYTLHTPLYIYIYIYIYIIWKSVLKYIVHVLSFIIN